MKRPKVFVPQPIAGEGMERLEQAGLEVVFPSEPVTDRILEVPADCEAILIRTAKISREVIEQAPSLKVIARHGIGVDNIDMEAASERGIFVTNVPLDQVIVTPHMAAHTEEAMIRMAVGAAEEIIAVVNGQAPRNCLNQQRIARVKQ